MLSAHQLGLLTDHAIRLHQAQDIDSLCLAAAAALGELIPCDRPAISFAPSHFPRTRRTYSPVKLDWDRYADRLLEHADSDPVYTGRLRLLIDDPLSATQAVPRGEFERTPLYNEVWKPAGLESALRCITPGKYIYSLEVGRERASEFIEADSHAMRLLARHLEAATDDLVRRHGMRAPVAGVLAPVQMFTWFVCDSSGRVLRMPPEAARLMKACLGPAAALDVLPMEWMAELRRRASGRPATALWYACNGCPVSVHIAPIRPTPNEWSVGFLERPASDPAQALLSLGLTPREADVLRWVAEGKSNADVGVLLGISALTVKKHLENIFHKLGVENRTTAVVRALEAMQR